MPKHVSGVDVVVQGGGMAGLTVAASLARGGLSVALLDRAPPVAWSEGEYRLRVASLNRASEQALGEFGAWNRLPGWRAAAVRRIEASDRHSGPTVHFDAADLGESHLAHIVENDLAIAALRDVAETAGVDFRHPAAVETWRARDDGVELTADDGSSLRCRLLIAADGADSIIRERAGIRVEAWDYDQCGLVCVVRGERSHGGVARQRFLAGGPLAFLPLPDGRCSIVWSMPVAEARRWRDAEADVFLDAVDAASGGWLGRLVDCGERAVFPLRRLHANRYIAERVALVGDAAHVIHPLAGQGANLGIADATSLAQVALAAMRRGRDPGGRATLRRYERVRRGENAAMQLAMEAFHRGFTSDATPVRLLRQWGFAATDRFAPARRLFMRRAMGFAPLG